MGEELKVSSPADFKKSASTRLYKCRSGNVYRVGKMDLPTMAHLFGEVDFSVDIIQQLKDVNKGKALLTAIHSIVPACIREPRITVIPTENSITADDIPPLDELELFPVVLDVSGYTKERIEAAEKFRNELSGNGSQESVKADRPATE